MVIAKLRQSVLTIIALGTSNAHRFETKTLE